jgi:hypothetical protein
VEKETMFTSFRVGTHQGQAKRNPYKYFLGCVDSLFHGADWIFSKSKNVTGGN